MIEILFRTYSGMVFRVCRRYLGNREEAEDLTQEVFLKVDRHLPNFQRDSSASTWIYRIAVNTCIDHLRTAKRHGELDSKYIGNLDHHHTGSLGESELAKIDLHRILKHAKPEVREWLFLTQLEGMEVEEVAAMTGKNPEAIAKAINRVKKSAFVKFRLMKMLKFRASRQGKGV